MSKIPVHLWEQGRPSGKTPVMCLLCDLSKPPRNSQVLTVLILKRGPFPPDPQVLAEVEEENAVNLTL